VNTDELLAQARLLDFVASLYLRSPDVEVVEACMAAAPAFGELLKDETLSRLMLQVRETDMKSLREDYYDLFIVPVSGRYLPPYESAQREGRLWGTLTHKADALYRATGFDFRELKVDPHWLALGIPDHIGFEMAFVSALLCSQVEGPPEETGSLAETTDYFVQHHLGHWAAEYGHKVARQAKTALYQGLGLLTEQEIGSGLHI
jgi:TorA maturation chaperone TorD